MCNTILTRRGYSDHYYSHSSRTPDAGFPCLRSVPGALLFSDTGWGQGERHKIVCARILRLARENPPLNTSILYRHLKPRVVWQLCRALWLEQRRQPRRCGRPLRALEGSRKTLDCL
jgi:hypothetical protein